MNAMKEQGKKGEKMVFKKQVLREEQVMLW